MMINILLLTLIGSTFACRQGQNADTNQNNPPFDGQTSSNFDCIYDSSDDEWHCCGIVANGESHCAPSCEWTFYQGKARRCEMFTSDAQATAEKPNNANGNQNEDYYDVCCDSPLVDNCGGNCKAFFVWPFLTVDDVWNEDTNAAVPPTTLEDDWRKDFLAQKLSNREGYDNYVYPASYAKGTLRYNNDPPVCVYVPDAAGKVIEIKVEAEEGGDRLCVDDVHDDLSDRTNPGQVKTCDDGRLGSCFADGTTQTEMGFAKTGYSFKVDCDESCEETSDTHIWFRARFSQYGWADAGDTSNPITSQASTAVEMWCDYVLRDYPQFDVFPSDLAPQADEVIPDNDSVATYSLLLVVFVLGMVQA